MGNLHDEIRGFIQTELVRDPDIEVGDDEPLITGGLVDSLDLVKIGVFIERRFGVRIDDSNLTSQAMNTVGDIVKLIEKKKK